MASGGSMFSGGVRIIPQGCSRFTLAGGGTPAERWPVFGFADAVAQDLLLDAWLPSYAGGGLRLRLHWTSTATSGAVVWRARFRKITLAANSLLGAHDYRSGAGTVTTTVGGTTRYPAQSEILFANGAPMESLATGDHYALMIGRNGAAGGDTMAARADLHAIELTEQ